jgi:hypothetical protein
VDDPNESSEADGGMKQGEVEMGLARVSVGSRGSRGSGRSLKPASPPLLSYSLHLIFYSMNRTLRGQPPLSFLTVNKLARYKAKGAVLDYA